MPHLKRVVSPVHVSRVPLVEEWVTDENGRVYPALLPATFQPQDLEAFTNLTLANLITQVCVCVCVCVDVYVCVCGDDI